MSLYLLPFFSLSCSISPAEALPPRAQSPMNQEMAPMWPSGGGCTGLLCILYCRHTTGILQPYCRLGVGKPPFFKSSQAQVKSQDQTNFKSSLKSSCRVNNLVKSSLKSSRKVKIILSQASSQVAGSNFLLSQASSQVAGSKIWSSQASSQVAGSKIFSSQATSHRANFLV